VVVSVTERWKGLVQFDVVRQCQLSELPVTSTTEPITFKVLTSVSSSEGWLAIASCEISGTLPPWWSGLTNLEVLVAHDNDLTGSLRGDLLGKLTKLRHLSLHTNFFQGSTPTEPGNLSELGELFLQGNNIRGPIVS
jgi:Leucine-rich repeat (LRR) protein